MMNILKVASSTDPNELAGAIAGQLRDADLSIFTAIGAGAVNQAVKAIAIAKGYIAINGMDLICVPSLTTGRPEPTNDLLHPCTIVTFTIERK